MTNEDMSQHVRIIQRDKLYVCTCGVVCYGENGLAVHNSEEAFVSIIEWQQETKTNK